MLRFLVEHRSIDKATTCSDVCWARTLIGIAFALMSLVGTLNAQTSPVIQVGPLSFTMVVGGPNPVPQLLELVPTGTANYTYESISTSDPVSWLSTNGCNSSCGIPSTTSVVVDGTLLAAGIHTGKIVYSVSGQTATMTVAVTLTLVGASAAYPVSTSGGLTFVAGNGFTAPSQTLPILNAGSGTLTWTAATSVFHGSTSSTNWLSVSSPGGTAPGNLTVSVTMTGLATGIYLGQVTIQASSVSVTVPVVLRIVDASTNTYQQVPNLSFTAPAGGPNPLTEVFTLSTTGGSSIYSYAYSTTSSGGNWLSGACNRCDTPFANTVSVDATTLAPGVYTGQIVNYSSAGDAMAVGVTLTVVGAGVPYPASANGGLTFVAGAGFDAAPQTIPILNAGSGTLSWTASASIFRGSSLAGATTWLNLSSTSGAAPGNLTVSVSTTGLTTGFYNGQITVQTTNGSFTLPVTLRIVDTSTNTYQQVSNLSFTAPAGGPNPLSQVFTLSTTTASSIYTYAFSTTSSGGNWLTGACNRCSTPFAETVSVDATTLAPGVYTGQIVNYDNSGNTMTVGVTLTVVGAGVPYPASANGGLTFVAGVGFDAAPQTIPILNAGSGTMSWAASASIFHGSSVAGATTWLSLASTSGTAPGSLTVSVSTTGLTTGTYNGQITVQTANGSFTLPVTLRIVDANNWTYQQVPNLSFTAPVGGPNPLTQVFTLSSTGGSIYNYAYTSTSSGGNWLSGSCNRCSTPFADTVSVDATTLAPGVYTGQIVNYDSAGDTMIVGVTLTVVGAGVPYPASANGGLTFVAGVGFDAAPQTIPILNAGSGTMSWTASASIFHGSSTAGAASWLSLSSTGGTAPGNLTVSVSAAGLTTGIYNGQITVQTANGIFTLPVTLRIVDANNWTYQQVPNLSFIAPAGGPNPLNQVFTLSSTGQSIYNYAYTSTSSGGNWLSGACNRCSTPIADSVGVDATTLAPGVYTGQIVNYDGTGNTMTVGVTLTVVGAGVPYPASANGGLTFVAGVGFDAAPQTIPILNAGSGTLSWTASAGIFHGSSVAGAASWLNLSSTSGTAPGNLTVSVSATGLTTGIYNGQITIQTANGNFTLPVTLRIVDTTVDTYEQGPSLSFTAPAGGPNPLNQVFTLSTTGGSSIYNYAYSSTSSGGNWLSGACNRCSTPFADSVSVDATTLAPGVYTGQIVNYDGGGDTMVDGVTLTVVGAGVPYPASTSGGLTFVAGSGFSAAPQTFPIVNAGSGTLSWTASASIFRGSSTSGAASWLSLSSTSGTAPSSLTVSVSATGLATGSYFGQVTVQTANGSFSVPVSLVVTDSNNVTFQESPTLSFSALPGTSAPLPQSLLISGTTSNIGYVYISAQAGGGGNWLSIGGCTGDCSTPTSVSVYADASKLLPGIYTGQVIISTNSLLSIVPVQLTVAGASVPVLGPVPGGLNFVSRNASAPAPLTVPITNVGSGTLTWTASASISSGSSTPGSASWLSISASGGTAPSSLIVTASTQGLADGIYLGQVTVQSSAGNLTMPVTLTIADSNHVTFQQIQPLSFSVVAGASNPTPQTIIATSTGSDFGYITTTAFSADGGSWLSISGCATNCSTPSSYSVSATASGLGPGTYVGEILFRGSVAVMNLPVTLTVTSGQPTNVLSASPSLVNFAYQLGAQAPGVQFITVSSTGSSGPYTTTVSANSTWLQVSNGSGTTPGYVQVAVNSAGIGVGSYSATITIASGSGSSVVIPVSLTVGGNSLQVLPQAMNFAYQSGYQAPAAQQLTINSTGAGLSYTAATASGSAWLSVGSGGLTPGSLPISVNPAKLANGTYTDKIILNAPSVSTVTVPVTLTVVGSTSLSLSTTSMSFTGGGSQIVAIGSTGPAVPFTAVPSTGSGGNWLSVSSASGMTPVNLTVTANSTGLAPGNYSGTVALASSVASNSPQVINVALSVAGAGAIAANPQSLVFSVPQSSTAQSSQSLQLLSSGAAQTFSIGTITDSWLAVAPTGGQTPAVLTVGILNTSGLAPGVYLSKVVVKSTGNPDLEVPVNLTVTPPAGDVFGVEAPPLLYNITASSTSQSAQSLIFFVQSHTGTPVPFTAQSANGNAWVAISSPETQLEPGISVPVTVTVTPAEVPIQALSAGPVTDAVKVTAGGQTTNVPLTVSRTTDAQSSVVVSALSTTGVSLYTQRGINSLDTRDFLLLNSGGGSANWAVTADKPTIYTTPTFDNNLAGGQTDTVYVTTTANVANEPTTTTQDSASLTFSLNGSGSATIPVYINVYDQSLPPTPNIAGIILGPPGIPSQTVTLRNTDSQDHQYSVTAPAWVSVSPTTGKIPALNTATLQFSLNGTTPTGSSGAISITFPDYPKTVESIGVTYVQPQSQTSAVAGATHPETTASCTAHHLAAVFVSPGNFFQSTVGFPQDIRVSAVDECGNALGTNGAATITFSSGDPAIALTRWPDGTWRGTWQPLPASQGPVTIAVAAGPAGSALSAQASVSGTVSLSASVPTIIGNGVVDAASQLPTGNTVAPGEIITIYGQNLADAAATPNGFPTTPVGGVTVQLGATQLPLFYVSPTQINAVVPFGIAIHQVFQLTVQKDGVPSLPINVTSVTANPGIFALTGAGYPQGQGAIVGPSGAVAGTSNPAHAGDYIAVYCSGLGAVSPTVDVSMPAPGTEPLARATGQVSVFIGNVSAEVVYSGLAPGFSGLYQINARVPAAAPTGSAVPVQVGVNNLASNQVTIAIQ